jgi:hypothetical protein
MRSGRLISVGFVAVCAWAAPGSTADAADRTSLTCIRVAEEGQKARDAGDLLRARELFAQCAVHSCPTVVRQDCTSWVEDARRETPSIVLGAHDAQGRDVLDARATIDGTPVQTKLDGTPIELNPGPHTVRLESEGVTPVETQVVLRPGDKNRAIMVTLAPPGTATTATMPRPSATTPPPPPTGETPSGHVPWGAYALGGVGLAAMGTFAYFGITGKRDVDNLRATCAPGCKAQDKQNAFDKLLVADIALGVGVVSLVAALWIGVHGLTTPSTSSGWTVQVRPRVGGAEAAVEARF